MKRLLPLLLTAVLLALASCEHRKYEIEMASKGEVLDRSLTATMVDDGNRPLPEAEAAALAKLYPTHRSAEGGKVHTFTGPFRGRTPDDVGGAGFHEVVASPAGSVTAYVERIRGNDDLVQQIQTRLHAADRLVDIFAGWLKTQVGQEKGFDKLQTFLDKDIRADLKNLSLYLWIMQTDKSRDLTCGGLFPEEPNAAGPILITHGTRVSTTRPPVESIFPAPRLTTDDPQKIAEQEMVARMVQYVVEKGYADPKDAVLIVRITPGNHADAKEPLRRLVERALETKAGIKGGPLAETLAALATQKIEDSKESMTKYLAGTEEYAKTLAAWKAEPNKDPNAAPPDPMSVLRDYAEEWLGMDPFPTADELAVRFACPVEPLYTNGLWDESKKVITWSRSIQPAVKNPRRLSTILYAVWTQPDEAYQKKHFAGAALDGRHLLEYCLWYKGLAADEKKAWDAFLARQLPGPQLWQALGEFRFPATLATRPADTAPGEAPDDYSRQGRELLLNVLRGLPATQPAR